ncbi:MAG: hypothetical protein ACLFVO_13735 [Chloroflexaceae bacterium]
MHDQTKALIRSIEQVAAPGQIRYTRRQLYYEVCRTLHLPPGLTNQTAGWSLAAGLLPTLALLGQPRRAVRLAALYTLLVGGLRLVRMAPFTLRPPLAYAHFAELLQAYTDRWGTPPGLLTPTEPPQFRLLGDAPDLTNYGLSRLLICQDTEIAGMLLANLFHMETSCAVLSLAAATPLPDALRTMLQRTPEAGVYLLHDAGAEGVALAAQVRARLELPDTIPLMPIGLRPAHALRLHLFATRTPPVVIEQQDWPTSLTSRERAWIEAGWCAEVAAVKPARLLLALRRILLGLVQPPRRLPDWRRERASGFMTWPTA